MQVMRIGTAIGAGFLLVLALVPGCSRTSVDKLTGMVGCDTSHMTYTNDILPIVQNYCYPCHGDGNTNFSGGVSLVGYDAVKGWATAGYLTGTVTHSSGYIGMPYGKPMLDPCQINKIIAWVNQQEPQ